MNRVLACLPVLLLILGEPGTARGDTEIPAIGQPTPFYGAAGKGVKAETVAEPIELSLDDFITFTLRIRNLDNAADVRKPDLTEIDAFLDFQVDDDATPVSEPAGTREFRYRLRPRRSTLTAIPAVVFPYYDPSIPQPADRPDLPFRKARSEPIAIRIKKAEVAPARIVPLDVPDFAVAPASATSVEIPSWIWWLAAILPPVLAIGGCLIWQVMNPVGTRLARRRRSRAARGALRALQGLGRHHPIDSAAIVACVSAYLAERHDLPGLFRTPDELSERMRDSGADADAIAKCTAFFREADAARFAPESHLNGETLIADAERLIRREESEA